jgi:hypothetical protein
VKELNEFDMGVERVAMMVPSDPWLDVVYTQSMRNTHTQSSKEHTEPYASHDGGQLLLAWFIDEDFLWCFLLLFNASVSLNRFRRYLLQQRSSF